jgi:chromosome partitioning protein
VEAERTGFGPVALVDTDPQGTLSDWWHARQAKTPMLARVDLSNMQRGLDDLKDQGFQLVIIDTPPAIADTIRVVVAATDLVLIPTRPSPHDLRAVGGTIALVEAANRPMLFVLNGAAHRARITHDVSFQLSQHGTVAPVIIYQRTDFATSATDGRTVGELDQECRSAAEITELWTYVSKRVLKYERQSA